MATNRNALGWFWSSAVGPVNAASGQEMPILHPPSEKGYVASAGLFYKADSLWAVNARSEKADAAKKLIDFLVNSPVAGKKLLTNLGVPPNSDVRSPSQGSRGLAGSPIREPPFPASSPCMCGLSGR